MTDTDSEGDRPAWQRFCLITDQIGEDSSLLRIPRANIARRLGNNHLAQRELTQWRKWIKHAQTSPQGMTRLLQLLRSDSEEAREWKGFSDPFPPPPHTTRPPGSNVGSPKQIPISPRRPNWRRSSIQAVAVRVRSNQRTQPPSHGNQKAHRTPEQEEQSDTPVHPARRRQY